MDGSSIRHFSRKRWSVSIISKAVSQPFAACRAVCTGAPKNAITASPMYLSSVPRRRKTMSVMGERYSLSRWTRAGGESFSEMPVNPRMSENITVRSISFPPSWRFWGCSSISSITSGFR